MVRLLLAVLFVLLPYSVQASDSLRTVREFGHRVFNNLRMADTLNGGDLLDSVRAQQCVRDAVMEIATKVGQPKCKSLPLTRGTMGYLVEAGFVDIDAVILRNDRYSVPVEIVDYRKFVEAYSQMGTISDTTGYEFCSRYGDSLYLYPIPSRTDTVMVWYRGRGALVTAYSDTVTLPLKMYTAVEYLATLKAAGIKRDAERVSHFTGMYEAEKSYLVTLPLVETGGNK